MTRDQLHNTPAHTAVTGAFLAVFGIQGHPPEVQVAGVALLFTEMCEGLGLDPSELINQSQRRATEAAFADGITQRTEMKALRAYIRGELR